jgi:hypothetical protein
MVRLLYRKIRYLVHKILILCFLPLIIVFPKIIARIPVHCLETSRKLAKEP